MIVVSHEKAVPMTSEYASEAISPEAYLVLRAFATVAQLDRVCKHHISRLKLTVIELGAAGSR